MFVFSASVRKDDEVIRININTCIELSIILDLPELAKKRTVLEKHFIFSIVLQYINSRSICTFCHQSY